MTNTFYGKLLPCPFCGSPAEMDTRRAYRNLATGHLGTAMAIYCTQCDADMTVCLEDHPDFGTDEIAQMLIAQWNKRVGI